MGPYSLVPQICHSVPPLGKMFSRGFSENIPLGIIPMFSHPVFECSAGHSNVFTFPVVHTVGFHAFPVVDAVFALTINSFHNAVSVASYLAHHFTAGREGERANMARFITFFSSLSIFVGSPLNPVRSFDRVQFRNA